MSEPVPDSTRFHVLEAVPNRLEASPRRPRQRWSAEAKSRLIEATLKPGANVSAIARQGGMVPAQLFGWRRTRSRAVRSRRNEMRIGLALSRSPTPLLRQWRSVWAVWSFGPAPPSAWILRSGASGPASTLGTEANAPTSSFTQILQTTVLAPPRDANCTATGHGAQGKMQGSLRARAEKFTATVVPSPLVRTP
ncbi:transposase [Mesorhizobium sp. M0340]|uniref:transposase n=1 Tax=Mesorhizobium sp. M0340 TaxID=2956939 RepID=UPI003335E882